MIKCDPNTIVPVDQKALNKLTSIVDAPNFILDKDYHRNLKDIHGATPLKPYFYDSQGNLRKIGWFTTIVDENSFLPEPFIQASYYYSLDMRFSDRSLLAVMNDEVCPYHFGQRIIPFAALFDNDNEPISLRLNTLDWLPDDALCFDSSTIPHSIVISKGKLATEQAMAWEHEDEEFKYDYLIPVANSFVEFCNMLEGSTH